jgi:hypothetical protein
MRLLVLSAFLVIGAVLAQPSVSSAQPGPDTASIQKVVDEICSDGGAWLRCYSLEPSKCQATTAGFVEPCVRKVMGSQIDEHGMKVVERLLMCFNKEFMAKYGSGEVKTPECRNPMKHLARRE